MIDESVFWKEIGRLEGRIEALEQRPVTSAIAETGRSTAVETETFVCPKVTMSKLIGGKVKMELWLTLGNGELSQWPQVTYTGDEETVFAFLPFAPVAGDDYPFEQDVDWDVVWKYGRKTGKQDDDGNPTSYKDLVSITEREEE